MKTNPVCWFEIYVQDMARAKTFYETVFQCKLDRQESPDMEMCMFPMGPDATGAGGMLTRKAGLPSGGGGTLVYFGCPDCAVEAGRAVKAGGKLQMAKTSIGENGYIALVIDTEGNTVGLHSME
ncbi:MAG TPA: VOC family protein [Rhodocyclaceae bacterium]|nr:VOC family protein [Rhodocyclaceae bacterium]